MLRISSSSSYDMQAQSFDSAQDVLVSLHPGMGLGYLGWANTEAISALLASSCACVSNGNPIELS